MSEELRTTQSRNGSLQAALDKAEKDSNALSGQKMRGKVSHLKHGISCVCCVLIVAFVLAESQACVERLEAEIRDRASQVGTLTAQLEEVQAEKNQLVERVASINSLLEASQTSKKEDNKQVGHAF